VKSTVVLCNITALFITALPQCTTEVERTFFRLNNNKIVWLCALWKELLSLVRIFQVTLKSTKDSYIYMAKQGKHILKNLKILKLLVL